MRPGPKKPGESAAEYSARVKAMEARWKASMGRPKILGGTPSPVKTPGYVVSDTRGPNYPKIPKNPGETKTQYLDRVRGTKVRHMGPGSGRAPVAGGAAPAPKPKVGGSMVKADLSKAPVSKPRVSRGGMKSGGMVKGKK